MLLNDDPLTFGDVPAPEERADTLRHLYDSKLDPLFWYPERIGAPIHAHLQCSSAWWSHVPFGFWIIGAAQPRLLVELGIHTGVSYTAFCQSAANQRLDTRCFAIDRWLGDKQSGICDEEAYWELKQFHDERYGAFSTLLRCTFNDALPYFSNTSIDLLHIDGSHTYDAIRHDFGAWLPKLSNRAVILLHDTNERQTDFGVWRFWAEISQQYPCFEFLHGHGLGILAVGSEVPSNIAALCSLRDPTEITRVRERFALLGECWLTDIQHRMVKAEAQAARRAAEEAQARTEAANRGAVEAKAEALVVGERARHKIDRLQAECDQVTAERDRAISARDQAMAERDRAIGERDQLAAERDRAAIERDQLAAERNRAIVEREEFVNSTFWQLTRPLRTVADRLPTSIRTMRRRLRRDIQVQPSKPPLSADIVQGDGVTDSSPPSAPREALSKEEDTAAAAPEVRVPDLLEMRNVVPRGRVAVVLHLYYPDLWEEMRTALGNIPEPFDLFVTLVDGASHLLRETILNEFPLAHVIVFRNHGRDLFPFVMLVNSGVLFRYELVCKIHGKRSLHFDGGESWRRDLINGVLGSVDLVERIIHAFESNPDIGIVVGDRQIHSGHDRWTRNKERVGQLLARIGPRGSIEEKSFPAGSVFWIRPFLLRTIGALNLRAEDFEPEPIRIDGATVHAVERIFGLICYEAGMQATESGRLPLTERSKVTVQPKVHVIAYYSPRFHPVPEDDTSLEEGLTEWNKVTRARALFERHRQPRLPGALGFYNARSPGVWEAQVDLARRYGLSAFCHYYYWFNGRGMLTRPIDELLATDKPHFPFLLCWANEPCSRSLDGLNQKSLITQSYDANWPEMLALDIAPILADHRYFRLEGRPMLLIYRVGCLPTPPETLQRARRALQQGGVGDVHIAGAWLRFPGDEDLPQDPASLGLDAYFEFPPHSMPAQLLEGGPSSPVPTFAGTVYDYDRTVSEALAQLALPNFSDRHRGVMTGWDNTPLCGENARIFHGATPANFRRWLRGVILHERSMNDSRERVVFINGWNAWADGAYLEPDADFGPGWLEGVASAVGLE
jgi:lipopolysaccharide biosynthesis protein